MKKKSSLINSFRYAFSGIFSALKSERNMKIHMVALVLVVVFGFLLRISETEWIVCILCIALVISSEMINTAIEKTVDLATDEIKETAKKAKDIAAGAVLINAIGSAIISAIIFIPKIIELLR